MENGKKVCRELKSVRQGIADANGIEYTPVECSHEGDCPGTCPACEAEVRYLNHELNLRRALGKVVVLAGLGLAVSSCSCSSGHGEKLEGEVAVDTTECMPGEEMSVGEFAAEIDTFPAVDSPQNDTVKDNAKESE